MDIETGLITRCIEIIGSVFHCLLFFVLWNVFVPVWKKRNRKDESGTADVYFSDKDVKIVLFLTIAVSIAVEFIKVNFPTNMIKIVIIVVPYVLLFQRAWLKETCFVILLYWNIKALSYFFVTGMTDYFFKELMVGIEEAADINSFVEIRIDVMQIVLQILYTFIWFVGILPIVMMVKKRERIRWYELGYMSVLNLAGIIMTLIMTQLAVITLDNGSIILTDERPDLLWQMPLIALLLYLGELSAIYMWQKYHIYQRQSEMYAIEKLEKEAIRRRLSDTEAYYGEIQKIRHDMASHMTNIRGLAEHGYLTELMQYIDTLDESVKSVEMNILTGNSVTDVVINDRFRKAKELNIPFSVNFVYDDKWNIPVYDVSIIISNLLDNAISAAADTEESVRFVVLRLKERQNVIILVCENSFDAGTAAKHREEIDNDRLHGFGLKNIREIAGRYEGGILIDKHEGVFTVTVMLKKHHKYVSNE